MFYSDFDNIQPSFFVNNLVRDFRLKKGLSQVDLSELTGLSQNSISDIEYKGSCSIRSALLISRALDVPVDDLFFLYLDF